jgi:hypothetical protein
MFQTQRAYLEQQSSAMFAISEILFARKALNNVSTDVAVDLVLKLSDAISA